MFPLLKINQFLSCRQKKSMVFLNTTRNTMQFKKYHRKYQEKYHAADGIEVRQTGPVMAVFGVYEKLHDSNQ